MDNQMFCFQCEQTAHCTGCTGAAGVCGKKAPTARLQDALTGALIGLAHACDGAAQPTESTYQALIEGLFTTITNVNFNDETITDMGITQSAVSHIIADLEKEFGCPLLVRSRAGTRLTAEGERLLPFLRAVVAAEERLRREAAELHSPKAGVVRIGAFTSVAVHWLPGILKQFQKAWPEVEIRLLNGDYQDVNTWLAEGSVDVGFVTLPTDLGCRTMVQGGLDLSPVITHRFHYTEFQKGFDAMMSGQSGKVVLDWTKK